LQRAKLSVPELGVFDEAETLSFHHGGFTHLLIARKEERGIEDTLEARDEPLVVAAVFWQAKDFEDRDGFISLYSSDLANRTGRAQRS
jgi:hypothetical protein